MKSTYDWLWSYRRRAHERGDKAGLELVEHYLRAYRAQERPHESLAALEAGLALARQMGEPWRQMFFESWRINTLSICQYDLQRSLDMIARAALEVRKPVYDGSPFRAEINMQLAAVYRHTDPIAPEERIRAAFEIIARYGAEFDNFRPHYLQQYAYFLHSISDSAALDAAWDYVAAAEACGTAETRAHYGMSALNLVCQVLVERQPETARAQLDELAAKAEAFARERGRDSLIALSLMWRALAARWQNDEAQASAFYERALTVQERVESKHNPVGAGAILYHEAHQEWPEALRVMQTELRVARRQKRAFSEAKLRLQKIELLRRANRDWTREAQRLRTIAARLPSRAHWEAKLDAL